MDVISMPSTISLLKLVKSDYPQFVFEPSSDFHWSHKENTIYFAKNEKNPSYLFHELAHAILDHTTYKKDIELLGMERDAWDTAKKIAEKYSHIIDEDFIQDNLDTYREWLHSRSTCNKCTATGLQISKNTYKCIACSAVWRVNEARTCALRRYNK
jgi:hypothetical protein